MIGLIFGIVGIVGISSFFGFKNNNANLFDGISDIIDKVLFVIIVALAVWLFITILNLIRGKKK